MPVAAMRTAAPWYGTKIGVRAADAATVFRVTNELIYLVNPLTHALPANASEPREVHTVRSVAVVNHKGPALH